VDQARNFCAIGSGATNAEAWLHYRQQSKFVGLTSTIVNVYEAKKFAEHAPGVGELARLLVIDRENRILSTTNNKQLTALWKRFGPRKQVIPKMLHTEPGWSSYGWEDLRDA
jgi:hypothetical protein